MKVKNFDVALTLKVTIPNTLAMEYRALGFKTGNMALVKLSQEIEDDDAFIERILVDNVRHILGRELPARIEQGGFGVKIVPLALQRANLEDVIDTADVAVDDSQLSLPLEDDPDLKVGGTD